MTALPILSGATTLEQLKQLLPLAYLHRNVSEDDFIEGTLSKAQTFDDTFNLSDLQSIIGINDGTDQSLPAIAGQQGASSAIDDLNQNYAWIEANTSIYRLEYGDFIEPAKFKTQHDNKTVSIQSGGSSKSVGIGTAWLKHPERRQHRQLVIRPSEDLVTSDNCLNEWRGFAVQPMKGGIKPFTELLVRLVPEQEAQRYVLAWLAHLIQHPEIKMHVSLAFWGQEQGVGKNLFFETIADIIGSTHAAVIGQAALIGSFNGWANRRVFIIGDEVSSTDRRQDADKLKGLITSTSVSINEKYQPAREVPNLMNFVFLSNHNDALFLDDKDRRFFVWEITAGRLPEAMAQEYVAWKNNGGLSTLLHSLLICDIKSFNPKAHAPMTAAKQQMVQDNRSDLETWLADLMTSDITQVLGREVVTAHELAGRYDRETDRRNTSAKAITGACKKLGAHARTNQVRLKNGRKVRAMAIARADYWKQQPDAEWAVEMEKLLK
ncbi:hypothetical protein SCD_n01069 [Sulfuricella denitrificans skB26]|uniref:NrS-1 polymerase-like helicase domain-containing protein n=1 Tax=Sulfuricella denitrificans (strain DSM 22764 / NBRC 105220 / skB26) TaxID=1163617 RepID=S6A9Y2_SULDS|nr:primase-helicase family protein [Sulfuricella denitrificans]BAN34905.1 hypothetical protein SCD_n01069 [Sulfuricella denitrificans skB26]